MANIRSIIITNTADAPVSRSPGALESSGSGQVPGRALFDHAEPIVSTRSRRDNARGPRWFPATSDSSSSSGSQPDPDHNWSELEVEEDEDEAFRILSESYAPASPNEDMLDDEEGAEALEAELQAEAQRKAELEELLRAAAAHREPSSDIANAGNSSEAQFAWFPDMP